MRVLVLCICLVIAAGASGQGFFDKFYLGGGFGFSAGTAHTNISVSPLVGYKITDRLSAGASITYQYNDYKFLDATLTHYGLSPFSRFMITRQFFAHTEYEFLSLEYPVVADFSQTDRQGFNTWFVGGGFVQPLGRIASFSLIALYNVFYDADDPGRRTPYNSPFVVRGGINVGF